MTTYEITNEGDKVTCLLFDGRQGIGNTATEAYYNALSAVFVDERSYECQLL